MGEVKPSELRNASIQAISCSAENYAIVEMANGKIHEIPLDDLVEDWLILHNECKTLRIYLTRHAM